MYLFIEMEVDQHVTSLFGSTDDDNDNEQVRRSPFVLLPPEVCFDPKKII
jgi:hypothetical protein